VKEQTTSQGPQTTGDNFLGGRKRYQTNTGGICFHHEGASGVGGTVYLVFKGQKKAIRN